MSSEIACRVFLVFLKNGEVNFNPVKMSPLFIDDALNSQFAEEGFITVNFLDAGQLGQLSKIFSSYCGGESELIDKVMYFSLLSNPVETNKKVQAEVKEVFEPAYKKFLKNYKSLSESFLTKVPGAVGSLMLHQDWNYVNETNFNSATIWCPLVDVTIENGAMFVIKRSHKFFKLIRSATFPTARISGDGKLKQAITPVSLKAGQALIFHQSLWHGSYPNLSKNNRIIATSIVLEEPAPFVYFHKRTGQDIADVYELNDSTYLENLNTLAAGKQPQNATMVESIPYNHHTVSEKELLDKAMPNNLVQKIAQLFR